MRYLFGIGAVVGCLVLVAIVGIPTRQVDHSKPVRERAYGPVQKVIYPNSVVPGGVGSGHELREAARRDGVVAGHYDGFNFTSARTFHLQKSRSAFVSYRVGQKVLWTRKRLQLPPGELLLTDGTTTVRTRCGNQVCDTPRQPVSSDLEPPSEAFDTPEPATLRAADFQVPTLFDPLQNFWGVGVPTLGAPGAAVDSGPALGPNGGNGGGSAPTAAPTAASAAPSVSSPEANPGDLERDGSPVSPESLVSLVVDTNPLSAPPPGGPLLPPFGSESAPGFEATASPQFGTQTGPQFGAQFGAQFGRTSDRGLPALGRPSLPGQTSTLALLGLLNPVPPVTDQLLGAPTFPVDHPGHPIPEPGPLGLVGLALILLACSRPKAS